MTREESGQFLNEMFSLYPNLVRNIGSVKLMAELWSEVLFDQDYAEIRKALQRYFKRDTKGFPPTAGQLIELTVEEEDPLMPADHVYYPPEYYDPDYFLPEAKHEKE